MRLYWKFFSLFILFIGVSQAHAEIYKCNGSYQTTPCKNGEAGGAVKNLPNIVKYDWLEASKEKEEAEKLRRKIAREKKQKKEKGTTEVVVKPPKPATRAKLKEKPKKTTSKKAAKKKNEKKIVAKKKPKKKIKLKEENLVPTQVRAPREEVKLLSLVQDIGRIRFTIDEFIQSRGIEEVEKYITRLWTTMEKTCREMAGRDLGKNQQMCKRGWEDLLVVTSAVEAKGGKPVSYPED